MNKKTGFIIAGVVAIIAIFAVLIGVSFWQSDQNEQKDTDASNAVDYGEYKLSTIKNLAAAINYDALDPHSILPASNSSGDIPENIIGDADVPIVIYEYADYPCGYCALMTPLLAQIVEDYDGEVAVVFRSYILPYHETNGIPAASAANAAALQGYWEKYKDILFANQDDWFYSTGDKLQEQLETYFIKASNGQGDLAQFREDMKSEKVAKKIAFDRGLGEKLKIGGTPWLYLDGEWISNKGEGTAGLTPQEYDARIRQLIDAKLK